MANKHYINEVGTIILVDCGCDITGATETKLKVRKPDGSLSEWVAIIEGTNYLKYIIQTNDLILAGKYYLQVSLILPGWSGLGETTDFFIHEVYK